MSSNMRSSTSRWRTPSIAVEMRYSLRAFDCGPSSHRPRESSSAPPSAASTRAAARSSSPSGNPVGDELACARRRSPRPRCAPASSRGPVLGDALQPAMHDAAHAARGIAHPGEFELVLLARARAASRSRSRQAARRRRARRRAGAATPPASRRHQRARASAAARCARPWNSPAHTGHSFASSEPRPRPMEPCRRGRASRAAEQVQALARARRGDIEQAAVLVARRAACRCRG